MKHLLIAALLTLFVCVFTYAQQETRFGPRGRERGYSQTEGDTTYHYTRDGRSVGYTQTEGDQGVDFWFDGRQSGYSETYDGTTYHYDKQGRPRGQSLDYSGDAVENEPADFIPQGAYWGVSGPSDENGKQE
jgi:hypothetical protein